MIQITLGGRLLRGDEHTIPADLKSGYRGTRAGSREPGTASFELLFTRPFREADLWFSEGAAVTIVLNGSTWFVGVVREIDRPKRRGFTVGIECAEISSRLVDMPTGMPYFGNLVNPLGYSWVSDPEAYPAGTDEQGNQRSVQAKIVRGGDYFPNDSTAGARGYTKQKLFDTFGYYNTSGNTGAAARRSMLIYEQPLSLLVNRVIEANRANADGPVLSGSDVDLGTAKAVQETIPVRDEDGNPLLPEYDTVNARYRAWGLFTRTIPSQMRRSENYATIYWRETAIDDIPWIELYQIVNHSVGRKLGAFPMLRAWYGYTEEIIGEIRDRQPFDASYYGRAVHEFMGTMRHGPYPVLDNFGNLVGTSKVAWYWIGGYSTYNRSEDKHYYHRKATVYEVDLLQVLDESSETVGYRMMELYATSVSTVTADWVLVNGGNYSLSNGRVPIVGWESVRTGGRYFIGGDAIGPVYWHGDLYLSEVACEFEGSTLADVLHNLGLVTGSEWWVDAQGRVVFRKSNRTVADTTIRAKEVIDDRETVRLAQSSEPDDISGIPLSEYLKRRLREQNAETMISAANRRTVVLWPDTYEIPLGSKIIVDGETVGKLVAKSGADPLVTLECERI